MKKQEQPLLLFAYTPVAMAAGVLFLLIFTILQRNITEKLVRNN